MTTYVVIGPAADILVGGRRITLDRGAPVPPAADQSRVEHLLAVRLIAPVASPEPAPEPEGDPQQEQAPVTQQRVPEPSPTAPVQEPEYTNMKLDELRAFAASRNINLAGATKRDDIIAILADELS